MIPGILVLCSDLGESCVKGSRFVIVFAEGLCAMCSKRILIHRIDVYRSTDGVYATNVLTQVCRRG